MFGVRLGDRNRAARLGQPHHLGHHRRRVGQVDQQGAGMDQVKRARWQPGVPGVGGHDLHPAQCPVGGELGGHGGVRRVGVQAHNPAGR